MPRDYRANTTMGVYAHSTGFWRQRALDALSALVTAPLEELEQRVTAAESIGPVRSD